MTARISADHLIGRTGFAILNGYCTVLVDGLAAGMWQLNRPASAATVTVEPFRPSTPRGREAIAEEGRRLPGFAAGAAGHNIRISSLN